MGIFTFFRLSHRHITGNGSCRIILQSLCSEWSILPITLDCGNGWPYQLVKRLWRWRRGLWRIAWYHKETSGPLLFYLNLISLSLCIDLILSVWPEDLLTVFVEIYQPWPVFTVKMAVINMIKKKNSYGSLFWPENMLDRITAYSNSVIPS